MNRSRVCVIDFMPEVSVPAVIPRGKIASIPSPRCDPTSGRRGDAMQRPRFLLAAARSVSGLRGYRPPLSSTAADALAQTLSPTPRPPARTLADLRRRLAEVSPALSDFVYSVEVGTKKRPLPKPKWMKETNPGSAKYAAIQAKLRELKLHTVCEQARCPNLGECWSGGEAGNCHCHHRDPGGYLYPRLQLRTNLHIDYECSNCVLTFCNVKTSRTPPPPDPNEPSNVAEAIASWGLDYIVITSVDRDDLPDQGSGHFTETVQKLKAFKPKILIEALGDRSCVEKVAKSGLNVIAHVIETVEELQNMVRDRHANFEQSIDVLKMAKESTPSSTFKAVNLGGWLVTEGWLNPSLFNGIPNRDFLDGTQLQFKSVTQKMFLSAEGGGGTIIVANRSNASAWETFKLWRITESTFQFRVFNGRFVGLSDQGNGVDVVAVSTSPGKSETFQIVVNANVSNRVRIRSTKRLFLQEHWNTFITEDDFKFISGTELNAVRIPVGWWIAGDRSPPSPFVGGSLGALDNAFTWADKYNLKVIIDLHAAPGSQNGYEHSASRDGSIEWGTTDSIDRTVAVIEFLAAGLWYVQRRSLLAVELLNEPQVSVPLDTLKNYYQAGYDAVRKHTTSAYVIMSNRLNGSNTELLQFASGLSRSVVDVHYYNLYSDIFNNMTVQQNIDYVNNNRSSELSTIITANGPLVFVGEWVAEWKVSGASKEDYQRFAQAQLDVYGRATFGWAYWTLNHSENPWSLKWMIDDGFISL
ncbi:hypothetical protein C4D60_Mb02t15590 [Musa balbisiana]|uniref:Radical SAM core domain-containing protein n=1 Tax=Musa balbisiana TaxID=52838 RepID=A0A4S8IAY1_MUSBA|nr:hypothetical protein C4D60_Mb02t15590 [Musa balbisiana]